MPLCCSRSCGCIATQASGPSGLRFASRVGHSLFWWIKLLNYVHTHMFGYLQKEAVDDSCPEGWWTNLLYINNLYSGPDPQTGPALNKFGCLGYTWYLANDTQFYILSPILLITLVLYACTVVSIQYCTFYNSVPHVLYMYTYDDHCITFKQTSLYRELYCALL